MTEDVLRKEMMIINKRGLHARASAKFVQLVGEYNANVTVEKDGVSVGGTSIMGLMMLAASPGCAINVSAQGPDAAAVMSALEELVGNRFGEEC
ncbi:HPr family phosphocarrier protein [Aquamicrobium zhengzhouense]|uniref:HPr family phosphocarrier protein n=1 Tax=Aquamicrobium zhengzhouense TaxID=2781738 RepID=A0ABS0SHQ7_9HYPH|nr:HPr family phosphocarrier protein [Aquamicrobium zhengzhouense]MBI1622833.1 HPr family phosphocarrier protein [Aquamicrobium zhengzhouense]